MAKNTPEKAAKDTQVEKENNNQYVSLEQFTQLMGVVTSMNDSINALKNKTVELPPTQAVKEAQAIEKAKQDQAPINPAWEDMAREIIGEAMDHCEIFYPKSGGTIFTVVIKNEFSNAPKEYIERHKTDRRSREIGGEGISGVETWCKLIKQNLKRGREVARS
jgi:hypothetical protein